MCKVFRLFRINWKHAGSQYRCAIMCCVSACAGIMNTAKCACGYHQDLSINNGIEFNLLSCLNIFAHLCYPHLTSLVFNNAFVVIAFAAKHVSNHFPKTCVKQFVKSGCQHTLSITFVNTCAKTFAKPLSKPSVMLHLKSNLCCLHWDPKSEFAKNIFYKWISGVNVKYKWSISEAQVKYKWSISEVKVKYKWSTSEV